MGAQLGGSGGAMSEINMTPLIDIVLVVLIIMMVNIPIQVEEMGVKLPSETKVQTKQDPPADQLVVALYEDGSIALNRRAMSNEKLFFEVTRRLAPMSKKIVFIDAHPTANYGVVVDLMDMAREAGAQTVSLARMKDEGPAPVTEVDPGGLPRGVRAGTPNVVGAMTEKKAAEAFAPLKGQVDACYNSFLAQAPGASGRFILRVDVGPAGEVMDHSFKGSTMENPELLQECISQYVPSLTFPAPGYDDSGTGLTAGIHFPLLFSPG